MITRLRLLHKFLRPPAAFSSPPQADAAILLLDYAKGLDYDMVCSRKHLRRFYLHLRFHSYTTQPTAPLDSSNQHKYAQAPKG